ncbi:hypothetical protein ACIQZI_12560 [Peribacillus sp. NPDC096379]|uniref:hypothetical protein n=1 Tax=Peribacillus sp. NPDC096379 TaxID=3364393 RepID=UPI003801B1E1
MISKINDRFSIQNESSTAFIVSWVTGEVATFNTGNNSKIKVVFDGGAGGVKPSTYKNPMLTLGSTAKPFFPRNPSYLFANVKLGQIGDKKDSLFKQDGNWLLRKEVEKDVVLDGSLWWAHQQSATGFKRFSTVIPSTLPTTNDLFTMTKHDGKKVGYQYGSFTEGDKAYVYNNATSISINNLDSGYAETYTPSTDEIKAYFNGWQVKTADGSGSKPTAWKSIVDGSDAPTQTLAYVSANKAPNYTPYKLSYALATPVTEVVNHLVEGDLVVNGLTQVEVGAGVIVREKILPILSGVSYIFNDRNISTAPSALFSKKIDKVISIYKNNSLDVKWKIDTGGAPHGKQRIYILQADFDPTAEYTVSYTVLEKEKLTTNPVSVPVSWAGSLPSAVKDINTKLSDVATTVSVNVKSIVDLYVRIKALGG